MEARIESLDRLIQTATETIQKANATGAIWLVNAAEKELSFARYEKEKVLKQMMEKEWL